MKHQFTVNELPKDKPHGRCRFRVDGVLNGKRKRLFFKTQELAERSARKLNNELAHHGHQLSEIPSKLRAQALHWDQQLATIGASIEDAAKFYIAHHDIRAKSVPVAQAWSLYLAHQEKRVLGLVEGKRIRPETFESHRKVARFAAEFGNEQLCEFNTKRIRNWLDNLVCKDGTSYAAVSKEACRLELSGFFSFCVSQEWIAAHPIKGKIKSYRSDEETKPEIFSVEEAAKLLRVADSETLPVIAIGLFAGLRPTEIRRLEWSDIKWDRNEIDVDPGKSKTAKYRFVPMSANLVEWLAPYRNADGKLWTYGKSFMNKRLSSAARSAGMAKWPKDGLRHSYGSFYFALTRNLAETSANMGHEDTKMFLAHYNNRRTKAEGEAYFEIRPASECQQMLAAA